MDPDLLRRLLGPFSAWLSTSLQLPEGAIARAVRDAADFGGLALVTVLLSVFAARVLAAAPPTAEGKYRTWDLGGAASALLAIGLLAWIVCHPSPGFDTLICRWDHVAFCLFGGLVLERVPFAVRTWALTALSIGLLLQYVGVVPVAVVLGTALSGYAAQRTLCGARPRMIVLVQAVLLVAAYAYCLRLRTTNALLAHSIYGLLGWTALRYLSALIEFARGAEVRLRDYVAFIVFYPGTYGLFGAPEVYAEFARHNLTRPRPIDRHWAARRIAVGALQGWLVSVLPAMSTETLLASGGAADAWVKSIFLFVRAALAVMGIWAFFDGAALFLGVRLRPNFIGLLSCQNASDLWRRWRGTMTNWLVYHVYAPLGANRRHQSLNVFAAFGVSLAWHWLGVFLRSDFRIALLAPISLCLLVNAVAVVAHIQLQRRRGHILPAATPAIFIRAAKILATLALGGLLVTLPDVGGHLSSFVRLLLGLH